MENFGITQIPQIATPYFKATIYRGMRVTKRSNSFHGVSTFPHYGSAIVDGGYVYCEGNVYNCPVIYRYRPNLGVSGSIDSGFTQLFRIDTEAVFPYMGFGGTWDGVFTRAYCTSGDFLRWGNEGATLRYFFDTGVYMTGITTKRSEVGQLIIANATGVGRSVQYAELNNYDLERPLRTGNSRLSETRSNVLRFAVPRKSSSYAFVRHPNEIEYVDLVSDIRRVIRNTMGSVELISQMSVIEQDNQNSHIVNYDEATNATGYAYSNYKDYENFYRNKSFYVVGAGLSRSILNISSDLQQTDYVPTVWTRGSSPVDNTVSQYHSTPIVQTYSPAYGKTMCFRYATYEQEIVRSGQKSRTGYGAFQSSYDGVNWTNVLAEEMSNLTHGNLGYLAHGVTNADGETYNVFYVSPPLMEITDCPEVTVLETEIAEVGLDNNDRITVNLMNSTT